MSPEPLSPSRALEIWACRLYGKLYDPIPTAATGDAAGEDFDATTARWVELFFQENEDRTIRYRSLAKWVHAEGGHPVAFEWRPPGTSRMRALMALGWVAWFLDEPVDPTKVYQRFRAEFDPWWVQRIHHGEPSVKYHASSS